MSKPAPESPAVVPETSVLLLSGVSNINPNRPPDYIIAVDNKTGEGDYMGKVVRCTATEVTIHPWNFMWGRIDDGLTKDLSFNDFGFLLFRTQQDMDLFFHKHFWSKHLGHEDTAH